MELTLKLSILFTLLSAFAVTDGNSLRVTGHTEEDFTTVSSEVLTFVLSTTTLSY